VARRQSEWGIWAFAFGYFACYAPYSALTKALSSGTWPRAPAALDGVALLPMSVLASLFTSAIALTLLGWWGAATQARVGGLSLPRPRLVTAISGLCASAILMTTTLAYTFEGVSIVFVMLLMRGGVLVIAPLVDLLSRRRVRWFSWVGLCLSLVALLVAFGERASALAITLPCAIDIAVYLAAYFIRLRVMSRHAKSDDADEARRFFVEEQLVATPASLAILGVLALLGATGSGGAVAAAARDGFTDVAAGPVLVEVLILGALSQGTGIFGGLIFLDKRENSFTVPVNRSASILAGVIASYALAAFLDGKPPSGHELAGAALVIAAIVFLSVPPSLERRARARAAEAATRRAA
jgi:drug/metabolite transporter (DMT)-like permease